MIDLTQPDVLCIVEAIYSFRSNDDTTLNFEKGDQIQVFSKLDSGWWNGWCKGKRGWFPSNYIQVIPEEPRLNHTPSLHSSESSERSYRSHLPEAWNKQMNEQTAYQYNEIVHQHPSFNDEDTIIIDQNNRDSFAGQSEFDQYENDNAAPISRDELMKNWVERKTPQGRSYFCNLITQETTWEYDTIDEETGRLKESQDENDQQDYQEQDTKKNVNEQKDDISWKALSSNIARAIHDFIASFQKNERLEVHTKTSLVIKSIRVMLYASRSLEKNAPLLNNLTFRDPRKMVITSLSKLVICSKMSSEVTLSKIHRDANDVLVAVRNYVNVYTKHQIPVHHVTPTLLEDNTQLSNDPSAEPGNTLLPTSFNPEFDSSGIPKTKFLLNQDLISNLQAYANQVIKSIDSLAALTTKSLQSHTQTEQDQEEYVAMFRTFSNQIAQLVSILDEINFGNVDNIANFHTYRFNRQMLSESIGLLFSAIQTMTNSYIDIDTSVRAVDEALTKVGNSLENIEQSVVIMVGERKRTLGQRENIHAHKSNVDTHPCKSIVDEPIDQKSIGNEECSDGIEYSMENAMVRGGTLVALVGRLTAHDIFDTSFITTFLLTYRSFCTSEEFITLLEERYNILPPENLTPEELETWRAHKQKLIRLRVFNVLKKWLENYYIEEDTCLLSRIEHFTNTYIQDSSSFAANQLTRIIQKRAELCSQGEMKRIVPNPISGPVPIYPKNMTRIQLLETDPLEMARQLSVMDFKLYSSIRPIECLGKAWSKEDLGIAANIRQSIQYCNRLTAWVMMSILHSDETKRRATIIKYWVQVANNCRAMNNFNTCMAILSAFDNSAIGRLKKTWMLVNRNTTQVLSQLRKLMGADRNFSEYRVIIHSINPPCIPFLGIYLQDLTFIEDGNPDFLRSSDKMINFAKRHQTAEVIRELKQFQSFAYNFHAILEFQNYIKSRLDREYDIDELYERSLTLEPRLNESNVSIY